MAAQRRKWWRRRLLVGGLMLGVAFVGYLDFRVRRGFEAGRWANPVRLWAAPVVLRPGLDFDAAGVPATLRALGYREVSREVAAPGEMQWGGEFLDIFLPAAPEPQSYADRPARRIRIVLEDGRIRLIRDVASGERLAEIALERQVLPGALGEHWTSRASLRLEDVPPHVVDAILAAEDAYFLDHPGINVKSMLRALRVNWEAGRIRQGGSTITQQFVKNHFLTQDRTFARKLLEVPMALLLEARSSKEEILEAYLATVYLGHDRLVGVRGLAEGARVFLGKPLDEATIADGALLAGLIRAPNVYSPGRHPERAADRREDVLEEMRELGWIDDAQFLIARREPVPRGAVRPAAPEAFFVQDVVRELDRIGLPIDGLGTGAEVFTTLDARLQGIATEEALALVRRRPGLEVEVVALDPETGALRALVGGSDFLASQLDRTTRPHGAAGSIFKPFLLLAAFASSPAGITPETILQDEPLSIELPSGTWEPRNADGRYRGAVTLREALYLSLNVPMVRLAQEVGVEEVASFADRMQLTAEPAPRVPAVALGAFDASLRDVSASYSIFSQAGRRVDIFSVVGVKAPSGVPLYGARPEPRLLADAGAAREVHDLLVDVADEGTARSVRFAGVESEVAGKTGTASGSRGVWFVGYTPDLLLGVRLGDEDGRSLGAGAAQIAVPFWSAIVKRAEAAYPRTQFTLPSARNP